MNAFIRLFPIIILCLTACGKSPDDIKSDARRELLASLPQVIVPAYQRFSAAASDLQQEIGRYCTMTDRGNVQSLQEQWRATMSAWQETAAYAVGAAVQYDLPALINYQGIKKNRIEYWLEPGRLATAAELKAYSVQGKGLGVIEYLLFEPVVRTSPQYCAYLSALADDLLANADRMLQFWQAGWDSLGFAGSAGKKTVEPEQQIVDELLSAVLQTMETVKDDKLGMPLGKKHNGIVQPDKVESRRSGHSIQNIHANIISLQHIFLGKSPGEQREGFGLKTYLLKTGKPEVAAALGQNLQQIINGLGKIPDTLHTAVREYPETVESVYRDVAALCTNLETTVLPAFDVQPGFNAKDGD